MRPPNHSGAIFQSKPYAARNRLFAAVQALIDGLVESKALSSNELCSGCSKFYWQIPEGADDFRFSKIVPLDPLLRDSEPNDPYVKTQGQQKEVWIAHTLPRGSLFELLSHPSCPICMLVLHLLSPLPIKSFLSWALDQPLSALHGYKYSMEYQAGEKLLIQLKQPLAQKWQQAGFIEPLKTKDHREQSVVWKSCSLSRSQHLNAGFTKTSRLDLNLIRSWINGCDNSHTRCAENRLAIDPKISIRLVDVVDYKVVHGNLGDRYLALSYVWVSCHCALEIYSLFPTDSAPLRVVLNDLGL